LLPREDTNEEGSVFFLGALVVASSLNLLDWVAEAAEAIGFFVPEETSREGLISVLVAVAE
jgi:hypothetical protein